MATTRGGTPADPTLSATTDDSARGGLFNRSNVGNIVQGVDVSSVTVNDSTITITINGISESFTLNQATDQTLTFTVEGGGSSSGGDNNYITGGTLDTTTGMLDITRNGLSNILINLSDFVSTQELATALGALTLGSTTFTGLTDTPSSFGTTGQLAAVNATGDGLEFVNAPSATVSTGSFSSTDNTVNITDNSGQVNLASRPTWGGGGLSTPAQVTMIQLDATATGFILRDDGNGVYTITTPTAPAPPAMAPAFTQPAPSSAITPSPEIMETLTAEDGTFTGVTATVETPSGGTITPTVDIATNMRTATVTIPMGGANAPGDYMIRATTMTLGADGMTRTDNPEVTVNRFIPFFQHRSDILATTDISTITASDAAWSGTMTAIQGSGTLYFAVLATELASTTRTGNQGIFPFRVAFLRTIEVTLADSTTRTFNVFRTPAVGGAVINNFA